MRDGKCPAEPPAHVVAQTQVDINYSETRAWVDLSAQDRSTGWRLIIFLLLVYLLVYFSNHKVLSSVVWPKQFPASSLAEACLEAHSYINM